MNITLKGRNFAFALLKRIIKYVHNFLITSFPEFDLITSSVLQCGVKIVLFENKPGHGNNKHDTHLFSTCSTMRRTENVLTTGMVSNCKPHFKYLLLLQDAVQHL